MKQFLLAAFFIFTATTTFATSCPPASPPDQPDFCHSFKESVQCHCIAEGHSKSLCQDMQAIYKFMMIRYWSLKKACEKQNKAPVRECIDSWSCYIDGGRDSYGRLCSQTGRAC